MDGPITPDLFKKNSSQPFRFTSIACIHIQKITKCGPVLSKPCQSIKSRIPLQITSLNVSKDLTKRIHFLLVRISVYKYTTDFWKINKENSLLIEFLCAV